LVKILQIVIEAHSDWSGNLLCVWIMQRKDVELKPSFANLLKCLSIYDSILLVSWPLHL
jgi:hypothetical protein